MSHVNDDRLCLICMPTTVEPVHASDIDHCEICGIEVWVSILTRDLMVAKFPDDEVIYRCLTCVMSDEGVTGQALREGWERSAELYGEGVT